MSENGLLSEGHTLAPALGHSMLPVAQQQAAPPEPTTAQAVSAGLGTAGHEEAPQEDLTAVIEELLSSVTALPPRATPERIALQAEELPRPAVSSLIVSLCHPYMCPNSLIRWFESLMHWLIDSDAFESSLH